MKNLTKKETVIQKQKLEAAAELVNNRYLNGLNDDDQVKKMFEIDLKTKGWTIKPGYDIYTVVPDYDRFKEIAQIYGYWSDEVKQFNDKLISKGGWLYKNDLNNKLLNELNKNA